MRPTQRAARFALVAAALAGCDRGATPPGATAAPERSAGEDRPAASAAAACPRCDAPAAAGVLLHRELAEASGVVASALHPDVYYAHNDSGDAPRFFAMTRSGGDLGVFQVTNAAAVDWEDMARGPCPRGEAAASCLYFADVGDNREGRSDYVLYVVPEPAKVGAGASASLAARAYPLRYPDGCHNAEALLIDPRDGTVVIVTKVHFGASEVFALRGPLPDVAPGAAAPKAMAEHVGTVAPPAGIPRFTGGDVHPQAKGVLLRTYTHLFFYPLAEGGTVAQALSAAPCAVPVADEPQGEAVGWLASGAGYVTVSEGVGASVYVSACPALGGKGAAP